VTEVKVEGLDKLLKKLDKLGGNVEKSTQKALLCGAAVFEAGAKAYCPIDTGQLQESIHTQMMDESAASVGTNVKHSIFVEFGTGPKGDPSVPHTTKEFWRYKDAEGNWHTSHGQPPQPFMRTAFSENKDKAVETVKDSIKDDIEELMK
jgi:HK97 gp10 family phage protein